MVESAIEEEQNEKQIIFQNLWIRLLARSFDNLIYLAIAGAIFALLKFVKVIPTFEKAQKGLETGISAGVIICGFILVSIFFEAFLVSNFGATLGKKLLNFKILDENDEKLDFATSVNRSFMVFWRGCYLYIPLASMVGFAAAADRIENMKISAWDSEFKTKVVHSKPKLYGVLIVLGVFAALIIIAMLGNPKPEA